MVQEKMIRNLFLSLGEKWKNSKAYENKKFKIIENLDKNGPMKLPAAEKIEANILSGKN